MSARRHQRLLSGLALAVLALTAEVVGTSLTHRLDVGRHVSSPAYASDAYYPFLLAASKIGIALVLAGVAWRFARAWRVTGPPRLRIEASPRVWLVTFVGTAVAYLVETDVARHANVLAPWWHSSALPVFAVLAVAVAVVFRTVERWLGDYERLADDRLAFLRRLARRRPPASRPHAAAAATPRSLFGFDFESRPPPLAA
jgi:hypothetical protein